MALVDLNNFYFMLFKMLWKTLFSNCVICRYSTKSSSLVPGDANTHRPREVKKFFCLNSRHLIRPCQCKQTPETVDHFLFDCDHFKTQRTSFKDYCLRILKSWPPSFATIITSDKKQWCKMTKYVHQTKHLILPSPQ